MNRYARLLAAVAVVALIALAAIASVMIATEQPTRHTAAPVTQEYSAEAHRPTTTFYVDGALAFTLYTVRCSTVVHANKRRYCVVMFDMENTSATTVIFDATNQRAHDTAGQTYSPARLLNNVEQEPRTYIVPPKSTASVALWFLVPEDAVLAAVKLHESAHSPGIRISVN